MIEDNNHHENGREGSEGSDARDAARFVGIIVLIALLIAFVIDNTRRVKVGFVFGDRETRLIYVLIVTFVLGILVDRLWQQWRRRRSRRDSGVVTRPRTRGARCEFRSLRRLSVVVARGL